MELDPKKISAITLQNTSWLFLLGLLEQVPYGTIVKNGQSGLFEMINAGLIEANQPPPVAPPGA